MARPEMNFVYQGSEICSFFLAQFIGLCVGVTYAQLLGLLYVCQSWFFSLLLVVVQYPLSQQMAEEDRRQDE